MNWKLIVDVALSAVRHGSTFFGGWLAEKGLATGDETDTAVGALITLFGFSWSVFRKWRARRVQLVLP